MRLRATCLHVLYVPYNDRHCWYVHTKMHEHPQSQTHTNITISNYINHNLCHHKTTTTSIYHYSITRSTSHPFAWARARTCALIHQVPASAQPFCTNPSSCQLCMRSPLLPAACRRCRRRVRGVAVARVRVTTAVVVVCCWRQSSTLSPFGVVVLYWFTIPRLVR